MEIIVIWKVLVLVNCYRVLIRVKFFNCLSEFRNLKFLRIFRFFIVDVVNRIKYCKLNKVYLEVLCNFWVINIGI